ncbi:MAG: endonuclease/exonuclease/phosphatase family protein [FCB group bacterium]|jgi:endonuclease/exonuclease/phosphatase family metal-dependent hydrolase|nr:endonuclease/exonuclease/phosphatase family protein [FCB group bacterium]
MFTIARTCFALALILAAALLNGCTAPTADVAKTTAEPLELRVVSFNVLVDLEDPWDPRKEAIVKLLRDANPDILGLYEMTPNQYTYVTGQLSEYGHVGAVPLTPEDIDAIAVTVPVVKAINMTAFTDVILFYRNDAFEKLEDGHWWLSSTPDKVSADFGNALPRLIVWAKLRHKATGRELIAVATHFDNSMPSQTKMAELSHTLMEPLLAQNLPMLFIGDFNTDQKRGDYTKLTSNGWRDSYTVSPKAGPGGRDDNVTTAINRTRIDHIFYHGDALVPKEWTRLEFPDPAKPLSDHYPVFASFEWK